MNKLILHEFKIEKINICIKEFTSMDPSYKVYGVRIRS
jgi:hypothetical protein